MRFLLIAVVTLLIFTTSQVAVAYERCDEPQCTGLLGNTSDKDQQNKKAEKSEHHCCSAHVIEVAPLNQSAANVFETDKTSWQLLTSFVSYSPATLYEPPSTL